MSELVPSDQLNPRQIEGMLCLLDGNNVLATSELTGIPVGTLQDWLYRNEAFKREYNRRKQELYEAGLNKAHKVLNKQMDEENAEIVKFRAANSKLKYDAAIRLADQQTTIRFENLDKLREVAREMSRAMEAGIHPPMLEVETAEFKEAEEYPDDEANSCG
jgi:hypothetical protein